MVLAGVSTSRVREVREAQELEMLRYPTVQTHLMPRAMLLGTDEQLAEVGCEEVVVTGVTGGVEPTPTLLCVAVV
jgi:hypothetical protein